VTLIVDLGIKKNFGDFELGFIINHDCQWRRVNTIGDQVWVGGFQHRNMEHWVYSLETVREL